MSFKPKSLTTIGTRVVICLLIALLIVPYGAVAQSQEENEPNDAKAAATPIEDSIDGEITVTGGIDWYSAKFDKGDTVSFSLSKAVRKSGLIISLYAPNGTEIVTSSAYEGVGNVQVKTTAKQTGKYYVKVEAVQTEKKGIPYTVATPAATPSTTQNKQSTTSPSQQASEPNEKRADAIAIKGERASGVIKTENDTDWYSFQATMGENVSILINKPSVANSLIIEFYAPDTDEYMASESVEDEDTRHQVVIPIERSGTHYIKLRSAGFASKSGDNYSMRLSGQAPPLQGTPSTDSTGSTTSTQTTDGSTADTEADASPQAESSANSSTTSSGTPVEEKSTNTFGPGFTGVGALLALFVTVLVAHRFW